MKYEPCPLNIKISLLGIVPSVMLIWKKVHVIHKKDRCIRIEGVQETILILYAHDGSAIVEEIQNFLSSDRYRFIVILRDVTKDVKQTTAALGIFFVTPDMIEHMDESDDKTLFNKSFAECTMKLVLVFDEAQECSDKALQAKLRTCFHDYSKWDTLKFGKTTEEIKLTFIRIIEMAEKSKEEVPVFVGLSKYRLRPTEICSDTDEILILFSKQRISRDVVVYLVNHQGNKTQVKATFHNELACSFKPKGMPCGKVKVEVFLEGRSQGMATFRILSKMESFSKMLKDISNPVDVLCSTLCCDNKETLDLELTDILTNGSGDNIPFSVLPVTDYHSVIWKKNDKCEYPTLLHLGAQYGLTSFCAALCEFPGIEVAKSMRNKNNKTPSLLAAEAGFIDLASEINVPNDGYMTMKEVRRLSHDEEQDYAPPLPPMRKSSASKEFRHSGDSDDQNLSNESLPGRLSGAWTRRMTMVMENALPLTLVAEVTKL